jgi:hypothetical protein
VFFKYSLVTLLTSLIIPARSTKHVSQVDVGVKSELKRNFKENSELRIKIHGMGIAFFQEPTGVPSTVYGSSSTLLQFQQECKQQSDDVRRVSLSCVFIIQRCPLNATVHSR